MLKKIDLYILKEFLKVFILIVAAFSLLVFTIDFMELYSRAGKYNIPLSKCILIVLCKLPSLIEIIFQFIILLSTVFSITKLSLTSELTAIYSSGLSLWRIALVQMVVAFILGIFSIVVLNPVAADLNKLSQQIKNSYMEDSDSYYVESNSGIWFKQTYLLDKDGQLADSGDIIIRANRVYLDTFTFQDVILFFTDKTGKFIRRMNVREMVLEDGYWDISGTSTFGERKLPLYNRKKTLATRLSRDFVKQQIMNKYEDIKAIPFMSLKKVIHNFKESGFDVKKFVVRQHTLALTPLVYMLMVCIALIYSNNNQRAGKHTMAIGLTILTGFCIYVLQNILFELGAGGRIGLFTATWGNVLFFGLWIFNLMIKKIELQNTKEL